jgi:hypothetical protein
VDPSLADDEERLRVLARTLGHQLLSAVGPWLTRAGDKRVAAAGLAAVDDGSRRSRSARIRATATATAEALAPEIRRVLEADVDAGRGSPLAVIRAGTGPFTKMLLEIGVPPVARDEFSRRTFPDDLFDLGPASFADVHESLQDPGLMWGAARAHVHLRRRRDTAGGAS